MSSFLKIASSISAKEKNTHNFIKESVKALKLTYGVNNNQIIPTEGPIIFVSNHPTGFKETMVLPEIIFNSRADLKIIANQILPIFPQIQNIILKVDVYNSSQMSQNIKVLRMAHDHLKSGGALLMFPAGSIGVLKNKKIMDTEWNKSFAYLAFKTGASIYPIHVKAKNPLWFYHLHKIHPILRTFFIPRMIFKKNKINVSFLQPIDPQEKTSEEIVKLAYDASN
jgi:putative hemolysin